MKKNIIFLLLLLPLCSFAGYTHNSFVCEFESHFSWIVSIIKIIGVVVFFIALGELGMPKNNEYGDAVFKSIIKIVVSFILIGIGSLISYAMECSSAKNSIK